MKNKKKKTLTDTLKNEMIGVSNRLDKGNEDRK